MRTPVSDTLSWFFRAAISLTMIVALLLGYKYLQEEFEKYETIEADQAELRQTLENLERHSASFGKDISARLLNVKAPQDALAQTVKWFEAEILTRQQQRKARLESDPIGRYNPVSVTFREIAQLDIELALLNEALAHARNVHAFVAGPAEVRHQIQMQSAQHAELEKHIYDKQYAQRQLAQKHPLVWRIPGTSSHKEMKRLEQDERDLRREKVRVENEITRLRGVLASLDKLPQPPEFQANRQLSAPFLNKFREALEINDQRLARSSLHKFLRPIFEVLPTAVLIFVLVSLSPLLVKTVAYYLIAPAACRRPAIRVLEECAGSLSTPLPEDSAEPGESRSARVSLPVAVGPESELLILPSCIQGMPANAHSTTKILLDWSMPITSLLAGMYLLTKIQPSEAADVTVSSATDPLAEFSLIDVPTGSALVLQPRALVGIVQARNCPVRIERKWRIAHLKAWMTLQFRYIVFHGPVKLVVKGCRGVRVEPAKSGRTVNQATTLGFSANLAYSVSRNETFLSYYSGERELFNDAWTGEGYCVYSETADRTDHSKLFGRGLKGIGDTILKIFGI